MELSQRMEVRLSAEELGQLDRICEYFNRSRSAVVRDLIRHGYKDIQAQQEHEEEGKD